jgi:fructosamine-3-kinase
VREIRSREIAGGCINRAQVLDVDGERYFLKTNSRALPRQFEVEARGLSAMRDAGSSLAIPEPVAWRDTEDARFLVTEYLEPGRRVRDFDDRLGRGLAELHACSSDRGFGFALDGYCGATPQPNAWCGSWVEFWAERRLGHQLRLCRDAGYDAAAAGRLEVLIGRLDELLVEVDESSLIHGDLWSGNLHVAPDGNPALIDPAAYFGTGEAELGMMALFGGFSPRVWAAYHEARPPQPGWRNRLDLYTLYHVLNHFVLFGGGYASQADAIVRRYTG